MNNTKRCKVYSSKYLRTVTVTGNWQDSLDSFIESFTIYSVGKGPCSDIMGYDYQPTHLSADTPAELNLPQMLTCI